MGERTERTDWKTHGLHKLLESSVQVPVLCLVVHPQAYFQNQTLRDEGNHANQTVLITQPAFWSSPHSVRTASPEPYTSRRCGHHLGRPHCSAHLTCSCSACRKTGRHQGKTSSESPEREKYRRWIMLFFHVCITWRLFYLLQLCELSHIPRNQECL